MGEAMTPKRGLNRQEAMAYVGVKRRTFDEVWRPQLVAMRQGACMVFDRQDLDQLFDKFKQEAAGCAHTVASWLPTLARADRAQRRHPARGGHLVAARGPCCT